MPIQNDVSGKNAFDASQMKMHLQQHLEQIGDILTTAENIEQYADFVGALNTLNRLTEDYYTPSPEGAYPLITGEGKTKLQNAYQDAITAAGRIMLGQETGAVDAQLRTIAGELLPMLETDNVALEMTNVLREPATLPVLISNARSQAVDMGNQQAEIATGQMSSRQHIKVQNGRTIEEGYFTAASAVDIDKRYTAHLDKMEAKYPAFKPIIDIFRTGDKDVLLACTAEYNPLYLCDGKMTADEINNQMILSCREDLFMVIGVEPAIYRPLEKNPDYLKFMTEFGDGIIPIQTDYQVYRADAIVDMPEGTNIDKRNVGMSRMARLLGKPDLVAEAKPMMLIENGKPVVGTFMKNAPGLDMSKVKVDDPITKFTAENFNNPAAFSDIAAMQAIDFICGNVDRHPGNFFMRFDKDPQKNKDAKLVGLSLIDNDLSFSNAKSGDKNRGSRFVNPEEMGVIGQDTYNAIKSMTKEQMQFVLADCQLTQQEIDYAWERKEALQHKIEEDMAHFKGKKVGELQTGKIRVVKEHEWNSYSITDIADKHPDSQFQTVKTSPSRPAQYERDRKKAAEKREKIQAARNIFFGSEPKPEAEAAPQQNKEIPVGQVVGNGIAQEADPLNVARDETVKLVVPDLAKIKSVGNILSERFPMSYQTENGTQEAFFTARSEQSISFRINKVFENAIKKNPKYADDIRKFQTYFSISDHDAEMDPDIENPIIRMFSLEPEYEKAGISPERAAQLREDPACYKLFKNEIATPCVRMLDLKVQYEEYGVAVGQRIETRNVAVSDISELLGVSDLVAKSTTAQVMSGGKIVDGVLMNKAEGVDIQNIGDGHPMKLIGAEQAPAVYNQQDALKKLADLQVLDYICMNTDRHEFNMTYQFDGLGTDKPKFTGVQGFDNDASFGTNAPEPTKITVISEEMAEKLKDPKLPELIAEKMQKNNLPESEIEAAKQRLEKINAAVNSKQIRTVKKTEWGLPEQNTTMEQLAAAKESIFDTIQNNVIKPFAKEAKIWFGKPEDQRIPEPTKQLTYGKAVKVDSFGLNAQEQKRLDDLTKEAEKEFRANIEDAISTAKNDDSLPMKEYMQLIRNNSKIMYQTLDDADPTFSFASSEYKQLKKAAKELKELSSKFSKKLKNDADVLSAEDSHKLFQAMDKVSKCSAAYSAKKQAEIEAGREPSEVGKGRMQVSNEVADLTKRLRQEFKKTVVADLAKNSSLDLVRAQLHQAQKSVAKESGDALRERVAKEIYYSGLEMSSMTAKKSQKLADALQPDVVDRQVAKIMQTPAFKQIAKMPDDELRALGQSETKLMEKYFMAGAKAKEAAKNAQGAKKKAVQANMNMNEPKKALN